MVSIVGFRKGLTKQDMYKSKETNKSRSKYIVGSQTGRYKDHNGKVLFKMDSGMLLHCVWRSHGSFFIEGIVLNMVQVHFWFKLMY